VQGISPLIWRQLLIRSNTSLATLHATLHIAFAWIDVHLHCFHIHGKEYGIELMYRLKKQQRMVEPGDEGLTAAEQF
jgi:hypothetical protein